jgi:hypothetical protein
MEDMPKNRANSGAKKEASSALSRSPLCTEIEEATFSTKWSAPLGALPKNKEGVIFLEDQESEMKLL